MASYDNRETCTALIPSGCIPYTGYISDNIKDNLPDCKPNANDVLKAIQERLDRLIYLFGETKDLSCIGSTTGEYIQSEVNEFVLSEICALKASVNQALTIDPEQIKIVIDILCLDDQNCVPKEEYTLRELFERLFTSFCDLNDRVKNIEQLLNL